MKTSNYILTAFLTFGFVIILTLFIDAKLHGKNSKNIEKVFMEEEKLDHFSVLVAEEEADVTISVGRENSIVSYVYAKERPKNHLSPKEFFRKSNDTIFVKKADSVFQLRIHSMTIKKVIGNKNSKITLSANEKDTLSFELDNSKLEWYPNRTDTNFLNIIAKNHSFVNFISTISYKVDDDGKKKRVYPEGIEFVKVSLKNHSRLRMKKPKRLDIEVDGTSSYSLFK